MMEKSKKPCCYKEVSYTYDILEKEIYQFKKEYPFLTIEEIGKSVEKRTLYLLKFGKGKRNIFICGGTHACEWITVPVLMKWVREICQIRVSKQSAYKKEVIKLFEKITIHMVPMVNPDGIELQIKGLQLNHKNYKDLLKWNNGNHDFGKWKANIRGVDLNRNFNANWEMCKETEKGLEITEPWLDSYRGPYPESEPETIAMVNYTRQQCFDMVLSYHTQGRVIYWTYDDMYIQEAEEIGKRLAKASGYDLDIPDEHASYGGYKDWFIKVFKKPGYTIECGLGENPLPIDQFDKIYHENFKLLLAAIEE